MRGGSTCIGRIGAPRFTNVAVSRATPTGFGSILVRPWMTISREPEQRGPPIGRCPAATAVDARRAVGGPCGKRLESASPRGVRSCFPAAVRRRSRASVRVARSGFARTTQGYACWWRPRRRTHWKVQEALAMSSILSFAVAVRGPAGIRTGLHRPRRCTVGKLVDWSPSPTSGMAGRSRVFARVVGPSLARRCSEGGWSCTLAAGGPRVSVVPRAARGGCYGRGRMLPGSA